MLDYRRNIANEFETLVNDLGVKKQEIQKISEQGGDDQHIKDALDAVDNLFNTLGTRVAKTELFPRGTKAQDRTVKGGYQDFGTN